MYPEEKFVARYWRQNKLFTQYLSLEIAIKATNLVAADNLIDNVRSRY